LQLVLSGLVFAFAIATLARGGPDYTERWILVEASRERILRKIEGRDARIELTPEAAQDAGLHESAGTIYTEKHGPDGVTRSVILPFDLERHADLVGQPGCMVWVKAPPEPPPIARAWLGFVLALVGAVVGLEFVLHQVVLSDEGVEAHGLFGTRSLRWGECSWFDLWGRERIVLGGSPSGTVSIRVGLFKERHEITEEIIRRVGEPTRRKTKKGPIWAAFGCLMAGGIAGAFSSSLVWFGGLVLGALVAFLVVEVERAVSRRVALLVAVAWTVLFAAGAAVLSRQVWGASWTAALATFAFVTAWLAGLSLTRVRYATMRRVISPDWARDARPDECLV